MTKPKHAPLFVLEMANNHMGDIQHGLEIIRSFGRICRNFPYRFAFKLQYRDLDSFIHPAQRGRDDVKYIKRFSETRLKRAQFDLLVEEMRNNGFLAMATPFDEASVGLIEAQRLDMVKIASCSFDDWPLLECAVRTGMPIVASTAGAQLDRIDRVVSFMIHREVDFAILHCVGEYPTRDEHMHLSQIDLLRMRYPDLRIGFSTHEDPDNTTTIQLAIAKGACIFEKHVGLATERYALNAYSATPQQVEAWLMAAQHAYTLCGIGEQRLPANPVEEINLAALRRGIFAKRSIATGDVLCGADVYFAFPPEPRQFTANDWSKYSIFTATQDIPADVAVTPVNTVRRDMREKIWDITQRVKSLLADGKVTVPGRAELEVSHHYGLDHFDQIGLTMLTVVNRSYCKKLLVLLPGQEHPEQVHKQKEETFHILHGELHLELDGKSRLCRPGDVITVEPGVRHAFRSATGAVIEELSSTHYQNDSFYTDAAINANRDRKTLLSYWMDWTA